MLIKHFMTVQMILCSTYRVKYNTNPISVVSASELCSSVLGFARCDCKCSLHNINTHIQYNTDLQYLCFSNNNQSIFLLLICLNTHNCHMRSHPLYRSSCLKFSYHSRSQIIYSQINSRCCLQHINHMADYIPNSYTPFQLV